MKPHDARVRLAARFCILEVGPCGAEPAMDKAMAVPCPTCHAPPDEPCTDDRPEWFCRHCGKRWKGVLSCDCPASRKEKP